MTVVKPSNVMGLISISILIVVAVIWGFFGSVPDIVSGSGVLVNIDQIVSVKYSYQGPIKNIFVSRGDKVTSGQIIARIERQDILDQIRVQEKKLEGFQSMKEMLNSANKSGDKKNQILKSLYDQGLITENEYINSRQTELSIDQQITEARQQILVLNENYQTSTQVLANCTGTIMEVPVRRGDYIQPGGTIAVIESSNSSIATEALIYFAGSDGKKIIPGMKIGIVPTTVKQEEYGYIQGLITDVSTFPISDNYLISSLQNTTLANTFHQIPNPIEVKVSIIPDPSTYSGYKWSSSKGPAQKIGPGFMCTASVTTSSKHPVELLIPTLKRKLLGIGDDFSIKQTSNNN
jgi:HlyD family secretion protein